MKTMNQLAFARKIALLFVLLFSLTASAGAASAQATDLHDAAAQVTKKLHDDPDVAKIVGEHIVVAPFENINGKGDAVPRILQEMLTTSFIKAKHFKVLERDQLQSALDELHFQLSDLADPAKAKKIGKLAGATYVLLGSISDTGSNTSINARIVSIETGESVAAEDVEIKTGDAASAIGGLIPAANPVTTSTELAIPVIAPKPQTSSIDLNAKATPTSAGQFTGQKANFGLLGGTNFQVAWRENLGKDRVISFSAGDVIGDGSSRFVEYVEYEDHEIPLRHLKPVEVVRVSKWEDGHFKQKWESEQIEGMLSANLVYLRISPLMRSPALITLSFLSTGQMDNEQYSWRWDGTTYTATPHISNAVINWLSETNALCGDVGLFHVCAWRNDVQSFRLKADAPSMRHMLHLYWDDCAAGDYDGDGNIEIAAIRPGFPGSPTHKIEIYSLDGVKKATTIDGYDNPLTTWNLVKSTHPLIVAQKHLINDKETIIGSYVCFIQWNGETYDEVWHSNQVDDNVIDVQVCDPKGEGKAGLVVLSSDKNGYYLTKIVPAQ